MAIVAINMGIFNEAIFFFSLSSEFVILSSLGSTAPFPEHSHCVTYFQNRLTGLETNKEISNNISNGSKRVS